MKDNEIRFPISHWDKYKNQIGKNSAPCLVSERWIRFEGISGQFNGSPIIHLNVMTKSSERTDRKMCDLQIALPELEAAIREAKKIEYKK